MKLAQQLQQKQAETRALSAKVATYEGKEEEYAQTLLCVNRLWEQLGHDVQV